MIVAKNVLMPSFTELESKEADIAMRRVRYGMDQTLDQLALTVGSWGNWTDAYRFAQDHNRTFCRRASNRVRLDAAQHQRAAVHRSRRAYPRVRRHRSTIRERVRFGPYERARANRKLSLARQFGRRPARQGAFENQSRHSHGCSRACTRRVWTWAEPRHGDNRPTVIRRGDREDRSACPGERIDGASAGFQSVQRGRSKPTRSHRSIRLSTTYMPDRL